MTSLSATHAGEYLGKYLARLNKALESLDPSVLADIVNVLANAIENGKRIFVCGNGGSASSSDHWSTDLSHLSSSGTSVRSISLSSNASKLTATGNDFSFDLIFSRELASLASAGDILIVISASGNSKNLIHVVETATSLGLTSIGVLGFDGGKLRSKVDLPVLLRTAQGDYGVAEDSHLVLNHLVKDLLMDKLSGSKKRSLRV